MNIPKRVTIELTNHCNRKCKECPRHKTQMKLGYIGQDLFTKTLRQLPPQTTIVPFFRGESLLHPKFAEFMYKLAMFDTIQLASNGDKLTRINQEAILDNVTFFSLSLHDKQTPTQKQTQFLQKCRKNGIETQVSLTGQPKNRPKFLEDWWFVDRIRIYEPHSIDHIADMRHAQTVTSCCSKPFSDMVVYWNGKVGLCNHDWGNLVPLGDLNEEAIADVWNGKTYNLVRSLHKAGKRQHVMTCRHCSFESGKIYGEIIK
jgi:radical SAM protein with 4Fe4S-binding SPASM domain